MTRGGVTRRSRRGGEVGAEEWVRRFRRITRFIISKVHKPRVKLSYECRERRRLAEQARGAAKR